MDRSDAETFMRQSDLFRACENFEKLVGSGILSPEGATTPWFEPVITKLLILLSDLLKAADQLGERCTLNEDILCIDDNMAGKIKDVTDLIIRCRAASCHITSGNQLFETNKFQFCVIVGKMPNAICINDKTIGSDFDDEIAVIWGPLRLYLGRNMMAAFNHVKPLFPDPYARQSN